ncbi:Ankyrin-1 [Dactylellina cionopaga]|nr:Ankyrin-1 [Dactylellina cionopaga]
MDDTVIKFLKNDSAISSCGQAIMQKHLYNADTKLIIEAEYRYVRGAKRTLSAGDIVAYFGLAESLKWMISNGFYPTARDGSGLTPLLWATKNGHLAVVQLLINLRRLNHNAGYEKALSLAIQGEHEGVVRLLLKHGANINAINVFGKPPLCFTVGSGLDSLTKTLIDYGSNIDPVDENRRTPLFEAVEGNNKGMVSLLVKQGANINATDKYGQTPLIFGLSRPWLENQEAIKLLVELGTDPNISNSNGRTPLLSAISSGNSAMVDLLMDYGASFNTADQDKQTPLLCAAIHGETEIARALINLGADLMTSDSEGQTPLFYATQHEDSSMMKLLIDSRIYTKATSAYHDIQTSNICDPNRIKKYMEFEGAGFNPNWSTSSACRIKRRLMMLWEEGVDPVSFKISSRTT